MPLTPGKSRQVISSNISEMMHAGYPQRQAVAASLSNARRHPRADGGEAAIREAHEDAAKRQPVAKQAESLARTAARQRKPVADMEADTPVAGLALGGMPQAPFFERAAQRDVAYENEHPGGLVSSAGPGRTDIHNVNVASGSYVLPADVVSGLGEGNTLNGAKVVDMMLSSGPYGTKMPNIHHGGIGIPHPPAPVAFSNPVGYEPPHFAKGGGPQGSIPIVIAGGEYVVTPQMVKKIGGGDIKRGHAILDSFVLHIRKKTVKTLKKLPGPVK